MSGDPLWQEIRIAINRPIDPSTFERCAQDMLRRVYPKLVPVVGGTDAGMDGSISSSAGPYPLICTTGTDVLRNLRKSISNHIRSRKGPFRCVLATSRALTPPRREKILAAAKEMNVVIDQIHDQDDFIGRLYEDSHWRFELLGVTGSPSALSKFPPRIRHTDANLLIGRDNDLVWLREIGSDALIVGQPGSGKTHLHQHLAAQENVLFAVTDDVTTLANGIRSQQPSVIVVDDAHVRLDWIDILRRLRVDVGAQYHIHANCWPNHETQVADKLLIGRKAIRRLGLIPRKQMHELIQSLGISGPDTLLYLLLEQAAGKPGLCAALVQGCNRDGIDRIWTGEAISDQLLIGSSLLRDEIDRELLARFSLGGDSGVSVAKVAALMGIPLSEVRSRVTALGAGGIVAQGEDDLIRITPEPLRAVLVRDVFFNGLARPDVCSALAICRHAPSATLVLISAKQRGAPIPDTFIEQRVIDADEPDLWKHYAFLSGPAARLILDRRPDLVFIAGEGLLHLVPNEAVEAIIRADQTIPVRHNGNTDDPSRLLTDWLSPWDHHDVSAERRRLVVEALEHTRHSSSPLGAEAILKFIGIVIDPHFHGLKSSPVDRHTVIWRRGIHSEATVQAITELWPRLFQLLPKSATTWSKFLDIIRNWAWPGRGENVAASLSQFMRTFATKMLEDLLGLPQCNRAMRNRIRWINEHAHLGIDITTDDLFDLIFHDPDRAEPWQVQAAKRATQLRDLAEKLLNLGVDNAVDVLTDIESEVLNAGNMQGGWDRAWLYSMIAERASEPGVWLHKFCSHGIQQQFVQPFLNAARDRQPHKLFKYLQELVANPIYFELAARTILENPHTSGELVDRVISELKPVGDQDAYRFPYHQLSPEIQRRLLGHAIPEIRAASALGEWQLATDHCVRPELLDLWATIVPEIVPRNDSELVEVFATYPEVGFPWIKTRIETANYDLWHYKRTIISASGGLTVDQQGMLLLLMNDYKRFDKDCFDALVGTDTNLFYAWLDAQANHLIKLLPLRGKPSARWEYLSGAAMDWGITPELLAEQVGSWSDSWSGSAAAYFQEYLTAYEKLRFHPDTRFHVIARRGIEWATAIVNSERERERHESV